MKLEEFARESRATHKGDKSGVPIVGLEHLIPQEIKFSGYDVDTENTFTKTFKKGQILFGRRRAYLKKAAIADFDGICSGDITVIEAIPGKVDPLLLPFIIQNDKFFDYAVSRSAGGLSPRVKWEHLKDYEFDLPPIEEQRILADKLWAAYRLKESYKKLLTATQEMVKSQFIEMFGNPVTNYKKWETQPIQEIAPEKPSNDLQEGNVWLLNLDMIEPNTGHIIEKVYVDSKELLSVSPFDEGNVLFSKLRPYLNKVVIPNGKGYATTELLPLRPNGKKLNRTFFSYLLRSDEFVTYANSIATGTKMPRMPLTSLRKFECILPPMEQQQQFVAIAEQADKSEFVGCKSQFFEMFEGDEYPLIKLGDYTDLTWGDTNTTKNSYVTEGYLAYSASGPDGKLDHYDYDCEGIVLSAIGADCGKTWFASGKWSCIKNTIRFWSTFDDLDNRFLYFATREKDFWPRRGGAQPFIPQGDARNCSIPLPPICLQRKFVEIAEQADKSEFVGCKSQFIEIFYGMETTPVKDYIDDSFPGEWGTEDKDGNGVKVIRTTNFTNSGKLNLADVVTRSIEDRKVVRKQIKKYDTILERSGGTADNPVGRVVLFEEDNLFLCNNFTQVLRFKDVDPRFAFYALYYFYQTNRTAIRSMGSKTTGIQNLNMSKYLEIGIPNASDEDQKAFVTIAEQADKSEFELRKSIEAIDQVIKSLINN